MRRKKEEDSDDRPKPKLKSLAQAARGNQLKEIRGTLIAIGVITIIFYIGSMIYELVNSPAPAVQDRVAFYAIVVGVYGLLTLIGALFIVLGVLVSWYPVPITIASLIIYVLVTLLCTLPLTIFAMAQPAGPGARPGAPGAIGSVVFRIIFIVALAKSVRTAFAYERERREEMETEILEDDDE